MLVLKVVATRDSQKEQAHVFADGFEMGYEGEGDGWCCRFVTQRKSEEKQV